MNMPQTATPSLASQLKLDAHWMPYTANRNFQRDQVLWFRFAEGRFDNFMSTQKL